MAILFCEKCGNKLSESSNFCSKCGNNIIKRESKHVVSRKIDFLNGVDLRSPRVQWLKEEYISLDSPSSAFNKYASSDVREIFVSELIPAFDMDSFLPLKLRNEIRNQFALLGYLLWLRCALEAEPELEHEYKSIGAESLVHGLVTHWPSYRVSWSVGGPVSDEIKTSALSALAKHGFDLSDSEKEQIGTIFFAYASYGSLLAELENINLREHPYEVTFM